MRMDNEVLDELLGFLAGGDDAAEGADEWLFPMDMLEAPRPALEGGGGGVSMALASPRRDCPYEIHERDDSDEVQDAQDDRSAGSSGSDASGHHAQQLQAEPRVATKKRRTRKQEIQTLHDHVAQLTTELNALKTEAGIDLSTPVARVPKTCRELGGEKRADTLCLWEKLAARQLSKRLVSEKQNRALREAVITHVRRAKRLRLMLLKRAREEVRYSGEHWENGGGVETHTLALDAWLDLREWRWPVQLLRLAALRWCSCPSLTTTSSEVSLPVWTPCTPTSTPRLSVEV